jgi:hypothetical protein
MTIGGKYVWKPDSNPAVGQYEPDLTHVKPKIPAATIKEDSSPYRRPKEQLPAPGQYDAHLTDFGYNPNNMTIGGKYVWKPDSNPPVGAYDIDAAMNQTKPTIPSAIIMKN